MKKFLNNKFFYLLILSNVLVILCQLYTFGVIELSPKAYIFNILFTFLVICTVNLFIKKNNASVCVSTSLILFVVILSNLKMQYTYEPLIISDFAMITMLKDLINIVINETSWNIPLFITTTVVLIICVQFINKLVLFIIDEEREKKIPIVQSISLIILVFLFLVPTEGINNYIQNNVFNKSKRIDYELDTCNNYTFYYRKGILGGIYNNYLENISYQPKDYNEERIKDILENVNNEQTSEWGKPNIVIVLCESFWNPESIQEVKFNQEVLPCFNKLKQIGKSFKLLVPTVGGLTANAEFEMVTGNNMYYYSFGTIPYLTKYRTSVNDFPSMIKELNKNGYITKYFTPTEKNFYNRNMVYSSMNINEFTIEKNLNNPKNVSINLSDESIFDYIIEEIEEKEKEEKLFLLALTEEAHMPFDVEKYDSYDINIETSTLNSQENDSILAYSQSVHNLDKQIGRLYDYIMQYNEPTIIVFFGDHQPFLKTVEGDKISNKLSHYNTEDEINNILNQYLTEAVIVGNFDLGTNESKIMGIDYLGAYLLSKLEIEQSNYFKYVHEFGNKVTAMNQYITIYDNKTYLNNDLPQNVKEILHERELVNYYEFK